MRRNLIFHSPRRDKLNKQFRFVRLLFKEILKSQSLRSRPWLKAFVYFLFIFFDKTSIKTSCFAAVLAICPERLNAITRKVNNTSKITLKWLLIIKFEEVWFGY